MAIDLSGRIEKIGENCQQVLGIDKAEVEGLLGVKLVPEFFEDRHQEWLESFSSSTHVDKLSKIHRFCIDSHQSLRRINFNLEFFLVNEEIRFVGHMIEEKPSQHLVAFRNNGSVVGTGGLHQPDMKYISEWTEFPINQIIEKLLDNQKI